MALETQHSETQHPLRTIRRQRGFSQEQLAVYSGTSARTIRYVELEGVHPQRATRQALARVLNVPVEDIWPRNSEGRRRPANAGGTGDVRARTD